MDIDAITTTMLAIIPALSAVVASVIGFLKVVQQFKKLTTQLKNDTEAANKKQAKSYEDIAKLSTKIASIEQHLIEQKERKK